MRDELTIGSPFPDLRLPDSAEQERSLSERAGGKPLVLCFVRGWWCPKEQVRVRMLVNMQDEIQRESGSIVAVTVDDPYVNGAFRAGIGAEFPFLSDVDRAVARELDLLESTDAKHEPYLPFTFVLDSQLVIHGIWCGFWFAGNPTPDELRLALRQVVRSEQPSYEAQRVWAHDGTAPVDAGITGETIWIREDAEGREIQRGVHQGEVPGVEDELGRSSVDGRPWIVERLEQASGRTAIHLRKTGQPDRSGRVNHEIVAPRL